MVISYDELADQFNERYRYQSFPGIQAWLRQLADLRRYLATTELKRLLVEAGYINVSSEPAQHIQKVFTGDEVFQDTFLVRESTSQLLLISEQAYREGRQAISAAVEKAQREQRSLAFRIDLTLFGTVAETSNSESTVQSKPIPEP